MVLGFADQFEALFRTERAPQQRLDSDCFESAASGVGAFPPINAFQQGSDIAAIIEMPGIQTDTLSLEVRGSAGR